MRVEGEWPSPDNSDLVFMNRSENLGPSPRGSLAANNVHASANNINGSNDCQSGSLAPDPLARSEQGGTASAPASGPVQRPGPGEEAGGRLEEARSFTVANPNAAALGGPRGGAEPRRVPDDGEEEADREVDDNEFANRNFVYYNSVPARAGQGPAPDSVAGQWGSWQQQRSPYRLFSNGSMATRLDLITERSENSTTYQESPAGAGPEGQPMAAHYSPTLEPGPPSPGVHIPDFQRRAGGNPSAIRSNASSWSTPASPFYCLPNGGFRTVAATSSQRTPANSSASHLQPIARNREGVYEYDAGRPRSPASISEVLEKGAIRPPNGQSAAEGGAAQTYGGRERERDPRGVGPAAGGKATGARNKEKSPKRKEAKSPKPSKSQKRSKSSDRSGPRNRTDRGAAVTPIPPPAGAAVIGGSFPFPMYQLPRIVAHSPSHDPMSLSYVNCGCAACHTLQDQLLRSGAGVLQQSQLGSPVFQPPGFGFGAAATALQDESGPSVALGPEDLELSTLQRRNAAAGGGGGGITSPRGGTAFGPGARPPSRLSTNGPLPVPLPVPPQYDTQPRAQREQQPPRQQQNPVERGRVQGQEPSAGADRQLTTFSPAPAPARTPHQSSQAALVETSFI